jgi:hypothetical protein
MATVTLQPAARKTGKPVARSIRLALAPFGDNPGVVDITVGKETKSYFLRALPSDFGRAFSLEAFATLCDGEPPVYHVNLANTPDGHDSCECLGFSHHGRCKHVSGLAALVRAGKL